MKPTQKQIDTLHAVKSVITMLLQTDDIDDTEKLELSIEEKIDNLRSSNDVEDSILDNLSRDMISVLYDIQNLSEIED